MRLIPALDLMGGQAVQPVRGDRTRYKPVRSYLTPAAANPVALAVALRQELGRRELYVTDLDALLGQGNHLEILQRMAGTGLELLVDAGVARPADAAPLLDAGAARIVVGSRTLRSWHDLREIVGLAGGDRVVFGCDLRGGRVLARDPELSALDPVDLVSAAVACGVQSVILLNHSRFGGLADPRVDIVHRVRLVHPRLPVLCGGRVVSIHDLDGVREAGATGALLATALYSGRMGRAQIQQVEAWAPCSLA